MGICFIFLILLSLITDLAPLLSSPRSMSVYSGVLANARECVSVHIAAPMQRLEEDVALCLIPLRRGLSPNRKITNRVGLAGQRTLVSVCLYPSNEEIAGTCSHAQFLT